jgi:hypothetical protein
MLVEPLAQSIIDTRLPAGSTRPKTCRDIRIGRDSDYGGYRYDPTTLSLLEIGGVKPDIRPLAGQWAAQELVHALVDILAELGNSALRDAAQSHSLHQIIDPAR